MHIQLTKILSQGWHKTPGFILKPNPEGFTGFMRAGFMEFMCFFINLKVYHKNNQS